jgi:hypothetical protein
MGHIRRGADGRRLFTTEFKKAQVAHLIGVRSPCRAGARTGRESLGGGQVGKRLFEHGSEIAAQANGDVVPVQQLREAVAFVAERRDSCAADVRRPMSRAMKYRFEAERTQVPVQWLSDNGSICTALESVIHAEHLGLEVITTPVMSPESNGMSEAFVNRLSRAYIESAELWTAASVIAQIPAWFEDSNAVAADSALKMKSPREFRAEQTLSAAL